MALTDELHSKLKEIYPESKSLEIDRQFDAEEMLDATKPEELRRWQKHPNRADIKGFDDRSAKEPSVTKMLRDIGKPHKYIVEVSPPNKAHDRFVEPRQYQAGRLIQQKKDKIVDYASMKRAVAEAWSQDKGLENLLGVLREDDWVYLWNHPVIQHYVDENTRPILLRYIMRKYGVEPNKASIVLNRLTPSMRRKLHYKLRLSRLRLPRLRIRHRPRQRSKVTRRRWSQQELNFIALNQHLPIERLVEAFNSAFKEQRSFTAIQSKLRQIKRQRKH